MSGSDGLTVSDLAREIPGDVEVVGDGEARVSGVRHDSRAIEPGDLFVARRGARSDGTAFVRDALARGASAVLFGRDTPVEPSLPVPQIVVDDVGDGLAYAAAAVYGHPTFSLEMVGITGTNGKTTTTYLVRAAVDAALGGSFCGIVGTVGHRYGDYRVDAAHTTPEADELARVLAGMRKRGASHVAMEVSSIALASGRVKAVRFRVAALTNLTQDHLDFHGTMEEYAEAKAALFTKYAAGVSVLNIDDPFGASLVARVRGPMVRVSARLTTREGAEIAPRSATMSAEGIDTVLRTPQGDVRVRSRLVGAHNLENIALAMGIAHALELDLARAAEGIGAEGGAPGRLERCDDEGDDVIVVVDYAHTPDALARVLDSVKSVAGRRLWCVFGCGGDRDASKRSLMGEAAAKRADAVVITSDNPRSESPADIANPIERGARSAGLRELDLGTIARGDRGYAVELDRARAIEAAVLEAAPGDVIVIAGKGHEDYQVIGKETRHFDDREEARRALEKRRAREAQRGFLPSVPGPAGVT